MRPLSDKLGKVVLIHLSDLHVGSDVGLWPTGYTTELGGHIGQNRFQKRMWRYWENLVDQVMDYVGKRPYCVLANGDLVDGIHHNTTEVMSIKKADQVRACSSLLGRVFHKREKLIIVRGTPCHVEDNEGFIGNELNALYNPEEGCRSFRAFYGKWNGLLVDAKHHMTCGTRAWTEGTALAALLNNARAQCVRAKMAAPQVVLRAHRHRLGVYSDGAGLVNVNSAWQGLTLHGHKVVPEAIPQPSISVLSSTRFGELPECRLFVVPAQKRRVVNLDELGK